MTGPELDAAELDAAAELEAEGLGASGRARACRLAGGMTTVATRSGNCSEYRCCPAYT
jgi:hypothetical protein